MRYPAGRQAAPPQPDRAIRAIIRCLLRRRLLPRLLQRENAGDGGPPADGRIELHRTTVQLDEGTHDREAKPGAAALGAERMALEAVEHAIADLSRDAGA